jgi:hypothetical protein
MQNVKNLLNEIKINKFLLIFIFYSIGFIYVVTYYKQFSIDILNYLTINDLLFFSIEISIFFLKIFLSSFLLILILFKIISFFFRRKNLKVFKRINNLLNVILSIISLYIVFTIEKLNYYPIFPLVVFNTLLFRFLIDDKYLISIFQNEIKLDENKEYTSRINLLFNKITFKKKVIIYFFIIIFSTISISVINSNYVKNGNNLNEVKISFIHNNKSFSTYNNQKYFYIGETYEFLFLYNTDNKRSQIFYKNQLIDFNILNNDNILQIIYKKLKELN